MKRSISLILLLAMTLSCLYLPAMAEPVPDIAITEKPDYIGWLLEKYDYMMEGKNSHRQQCNTAIRYYLYTKDEKYLADADRLFHELMAQFQADNAVLKEYGNDFFSGNYLVQAYWELKKAGKITAADTEIFLKYLDDFFRSSLLASHNQVIARAVGMAYAVQALPNAPKWQEWRDWLDAEWNYWYEDKDLQEDAGDYNAVMMRDIIRWAEIDGKTELLRTPEIKKMFERFRDYIAPNGSMPEYGDDFYGRAADWTYIFEYCANLYDDPTFAYAARKMHGWATKNGLGDFFIDTEMFDIPQLYDLAYLNETGAMITTRNYKNRKNATDKLLLRPSKKDNSPYIMIDNGKNLISHSHPAAKGSIVYYEYDNVPLYHSLTRRFVDPRYQNVPFLMADTGYYPFDPAPGNRQNPGRGRTNTWYHDELALSALPASDPADSSKREIDNICLRLSKETHPEIWYYIDNIRLEGPAGVKMLCDFEDGGLAGFKRKDNPFTNVAGGFESNRMMKVVVDDKDVFYSTNLHVEFSLNDYTSLKWDWKTETPAGDETTSLWSIMRLWDNNVDESVVQEATLDGYGNCYIQIAAGELYNNNGYMTDEKVENRGNDTYTSFNLNQHLTANTKVERRIVLTEEGYAVIQDTIIPGAEADGYFGGPIFNLYNVKAKGDNWFYCNGDKKWFQQAQDTEGVRNGMLVYYPAKADREINAMKSSDGVMTTFTKDTLSAGQPATFVTVLAPNAGEPRTAQELAGSIVVQKDTTRDSMVSYKTKEGWVTVTMTPDGSYAIDRGQKALSGINVKVNDSYMSFDQPPILNNDRVLAPMRAIFETLGAKVSWDGATQTVTATKEDTIITLTLGATSATVNGKEKTLDVPAQLVSDRTMVPIRFISEALGAVVEWNQDEKSVNIYAVLPKKETEPEIDPTTLNLAENGGMEQGSVNWTLQRTIGAIDNTVARSGTSSMRLETDPADDGSWRGYRYNDISVEEGETYTISFWVKGENIQPGTLVRASFGIKDGVGEWIVKDNDKSTTNLLRCTDISNNWTQVTGSYTIPAGGARLSYLTLRMDTKDTTAVKQKVWFDDLTVVWGTKALVPDAKPVDNQADAAPAIPATPVATAPTGVNLLTNGDVESGETGWKLQKASGAVDTAIKRSGNASLRLDNDTATDISWRGWRHDDIPVEAGATYTITAWVKTKDLQTNSAARISFGVKDAGGQWIVADNADATKNLLSYTHKNGDGTKDWFQLTCTYTIPENGVAISYFCPRLDRKDTSAAIPQSVWFDDIMITKN